MRSQYQKFHEVMCPGCVSMTIIVNLSYFANRFCSPQVIPGSNPVGMKVLYIYLTNFCLTSLLLLIDKVANTFEFAGIEKRARKFPL